MGLPVQPMGFLATIAVKVHADARLCPVIRSGITAKKIPADRIRRQIELFGACDAVSETTLTTEVIAGLIVISLLCSPRVDDGVAATRSTH